MCRTSIKEPRLYDKLPAVGLVAARERTEYATLAAFLDGHKLRVNVKEATVKDWDHSLAD